MKGTTIIDQEAHELAREIDDIFAQGWSGVAQRTSFVQVKLRSALLRISQAASSEPPRASAGPGTKPSRARPPGLIRTTIQPGSREDLAISFAASLRTTPVLWEDWLKLADLLDTIKVEHLPPGYVSPIMWSVFSLRENIRQFHAHAHTQKAEKVSGNKGAYMAGHSFVASDYSPLRCGVCGEIAGMHVDRDVWPPARPRPEDAERDVDRQLRQVSELLAMCNHVFEISIGGASRRCVYCGVDEVVDPDFAEVEEAPRPRMKPVTDGDLGDDEEAPAAR
jgi:hypothetical protein